MLGKHSRSELFMLPQSIGWAKRYRIEGLERRPQGGLAVDGTGPRLRLSFAPRGLSILHDRARPRGSRSAPDNRCFWVRSL